MFQKVAFCAEAGLLAFQILTEIDNLGEEFLVAPMQPLRELVQAVKDFTVEFGDEDGVYHLPNHAPDLEQEKKEIESMGEAVRNHLQAQWKAICPMHEVHKRLRLFRRTDVLADLLALLSKQLAWAGLFMVSVYVAQGVC